MAEPQNQVALAERISTYMLRAAEATEALVMISERIAERAQLDLDLRIAAQNLRAVSSRLLRDAQALRELAEDPAAAAADHD